MRSGDDGRELDRRHRMPQGTIRSFDPATGTGSLLDDRLVEHRFDRETFVASGLMDLRLGQRVRFELEGPEDDKRLTQLNLVSL
jgi:cold shock CspA family protein